MLGNGRLRERRVFWLVTIVLAGTLGALFAHHYAPANSFKAFYCGSKVALHRQNPYLVEPLRTCEHRIYAAEDFPSSAVEPDPLPPYALAALAPLTALSPRVAHLVFVGFLLAALIATALALSQLTGFPPVLVLLASLALWLLNVDFAEIPPIAVAAIALCAWALSCDRPVFAGVAACASMMQPHLGLPLCAALFVYVPRSRGILLLGGLALIALGIFTLGGSTSLAYFTVYLPGHAASEIIATDQYSLSHVLHLAGLSDRAALAAGSLSYALLGIAGVVVGHGVAMRMRAPAFLAVTPPAFVLLGGTFVHDIQMFAAVPLALLLLATLPGRRRGAAIGFALVSVVWYFGNSRVFDVFAILSIAAVASLTVQTHALRVAKIVATAAILLAVVVFVGHLPARVPHNDSKPSAITVARTAPASDAWNAYLRDTAELDRPTVRSEGRKVPTWVGLVLLIATAFSLARERGAETTLPASQIPKETAPAADG